MKRFEGQKENRVAFKVDLDKCEVTYIKSDGEFAILTKRGLKDRIGRIKSRQGETDSHTR